jgi:hypothetical protein
MPKPTKFTVLSLALLLALVMAAVLPISALAQDEVPPVPAAEEIPPVEDESAPVEEPAAVEEPAPAEEPAAVEESAPAEEESPTVPEILEALPEGADLVVLDESGEALPLVTQEAAEVVAAADDPFFWDGTQYVGYSTTGACAAQVTVCNTSATPLQAAIDAFRDTPTATGSIYVAAGTYTANVIIDGPTGNLANLVGVVGQGSSITSLTGALTIQNYNVFTLQGITFETVIFNKVPTVNFTEFAWTGVLSLNDTNTTNLTNCPSCSMIAFMKGSGTPQEILQWAPEHPVPPPSVVPPSAVVSTIGGDDNESQNVFAPLFVSDIVVVTAPSTAGDLPTDLPAGKTFAAGASLTLMQNGEEIQSAPGGAQAFFEIPAGMEPPFVVLFWNGSEWVEIPSQVVDGKVVFTITNPGVYVLAQ